MIEIRHEAGALRDVGKEVVDVVDSDVDGTTAFGADEMLMQVVFCEVIDGGAVSDVHVAQHAGLLKDLERAINGRPVDAAPVLGFGIGEYLRRREVLVVVGHDHRTHGPSRSCDS